MIDWDRIEELRRDFGEEDFLEIVGLFLSEVQAKLDEMSEPTFHPRAEDFHFLKGSAANLGFRDFHAACAAAETGRVPVDMAEITTLFLRSKDAFLGQVGAKTKVA